jgi:hypothetical protein
VLSSFNIQAKNPEQIFKTGGRVDEDVLGGSPDLPRFFK